MPLWQLGARIPLSKGGTMSTAINLHREIICTLKEVNFAGLLLQHVRNVPANAIFENSGRAIFLIEGFWYELSGCLLYRADNDVVAVVGKKGATLLAWNGKGTQLEEGIWRVSGA
jgi:hypothetical protein